MRYKHNIKRSRLQRANDWLTWWKVVIIGILLGLIMLLVILPIIYTLNRQIDAELKSNEIEYQYKIRRIGESPQGI